MANAVRRGIFPVRRAGGGRVTYKRVLVASAYAVGSSAPLWAGDAVYEVSDGTYARAAATDKITSFMVGASYVNAAGQRVESTYLPTATAYSGTGFRPSDGAYIYIVEDAFNVLFEAQINGIMDQDVSDETLNYDIVYTATATTTSGSQCELAETSGATTTFQMRLESIVESPDNDMSLTNGKVLCRINESLDATAQTATAVGTY